MFRWFKRLKMMFKTCKIYRWCIMCILYIFQGSLEYVFSCNTVPSSCAHKWYSVGPGTVGAPSTLTLQLPFCCGSELTELFAWCYRLTYVVMLCVVVRWLFMSWVDLFLVALWCPAIYGTKSAPSGKMCMYCV